MTAIDAQFYWQSELRTPDELRRFAQAALMQSRNYTFPPPTPAIGVLQAQPDQRPTGMLMVEQAKLALQLADTLMYRIKEEP